MSSARFAKHFVLALVLLPAATQADVNTQESQERERLAAEAPEAARLVREAEAALAANDPQRAVGLFARAREIARNSALPARRHCEALVALGDRAKAIVACREASRVGGSPLELRASVAAHVRGPVPPTSEELAFASLLAEEVKRRVPTTVYGAAAWCDVARRVDDQRMLRDCLEEMRRLGPDHPETKRMMALVAPKTPWGRVFGWGILGAMVLATGVHALTRRQRLARVSAGAALLLALAPSGGAWANSPPLGTMPIDDQNPEGSVPTRERIAAEPLQFGYFLQDLIERGAQASARGDHASAVRYYRALAKAVPDRATSFRKLCAAQEATGDRKGALDACATTLTREGVTLDDHARFVRLILEAPGPLPEKERNAALGAIEHLRGQPAGKVVGNHLACELALRLEDRALLQSCTTGLGAAAPNDPKTVSFQWALALHERDADEARRLVKRAEELGLPPAAVKQMHEATEAQVGGVRPWTAAAGLLAMVLLGGAFAMRSRRRAERA